MESEQFQNFTLLYWKLLVQQNKMQVNAGDMKSVRNCQIEGDKRETENGGIFLKRQAWA